MFGGLPKVELPSVNLPDIKLPGGLPGLGGAKIDVKELQAKLDDAEKAIYDITQGAIPKVDIPFPKLPLDALGGVGANDYSALPLEQQGKVKKGKAKASAKASAKRKQVEAKAKQAAEAKQQVVAAAKTAFASS